MAASASTIDATPISPTAILGDLGDSALAPVSGWQRMFVDWLLVGGSNVVCQALGVVTSLLLRVVLDPAQMGVWQGLRLFLGYANYANLGVSKGAAREFNIAFGRGETAAAERGLSLAFTVNTLSSLLYAAVLVGAGLWIGGTSQSAWGGTWAVGLAAMGGMVILSRYVTFQVTILRAAQGFTSTSQLSVLEAVLTIAVCAPAAWCFGLAGLYAGTLAVMMGTLVFVECHRLVRLRWAWDRREIARLVAIGLPILLIGVVQSLLASLDKLMILGCTSDREFQLGCYSVTQMVATQLFGLGNVLAIVIGPRLGEKYGRSGDRAQTAGLAARVSELVAAALALFAGLAIVAAPTLLGHLLPDYRPGLAPLVWIVPGVVAQAMTLPAAQYLVAVDRQNRALAVVTLAAVVAAIGDYVALNWGYGLVGLAAATSVAYLIYFVLSVAVSYWSELDRRQRNRFAAMLVLALLPTLALAVVLERLWPGPTQTWTLTALKAAAVTAAWSLTALGIWRLGGWRGEVRGTRCEM